MKRILKLLLSWNGKINSKDFIVGKLLVYIIFPMVLFSLFTAILMFIALPNINLLRTLVYNFPIVIFCFMVYCNIIITTKRLRDIKASKYWAIVALIPILGGLITFPVSWSLYFEEGTEK